MKFDVENRLPIIQEFKELHNLFKLNGHDLRLIGGCVRDSIRGVSHIADYDMATTATPEQMLSFKSDWTVIPTGIEHGTVSFKQKNLKYTFEITTLRKDVECDGRHAKVEFTDSWETDSKRRDFTINAMSMDIDGNVYDYHNGMSDLKLGIIRFVGIPYERIQEDYLRMIRAARQSVQFQFQIAPTSLKAITNTLLDCEVLTDVVAGERIIQEIKKCNQLDLMRKLYELGFFENLGLKYDLYPRAENCGHFNFGLMIGTVLYDVADLMRLDEVCKLSANEFKAAEWFLKHKEFYRNPENKFTIDKAKRLLWVDKIDEYWIECLGGWIYPVYTDYMMKFGYDWEDVCCKEKVFPVTGQDLVDIGFTPGVHLGNTLKNLLELWVESDYKATREDLLSGV